jgi:hypothetical protein
MKYVVACFITCAAVAQVVPANAADSFYIGNWKLTGAIVAPWADPKQKPDSAEQSRLIGKTIVLRAGAITGPPAKRRTTRRAITPPT